MMHSTTQTKKRKKRHDAGGRFNRPSITMTIYVAAVLCFFSMITASSPADILRHGRALATLKTKSSLYTFPACTYASGCSGHGNRKHHLDTGYIRHSRICNYRDKITPKFSLSRAKMYMPPKSGCDTIFWHMCVVVAPAGQRSIPWCIP